MARAYQLWKPSPTYRMQDFVADWGPTGYYGPVKSYEIIKAKSPTGSTTSVEIRVAISPFQPHARRQRPRKIPKNQNRNRLDRLQRQILQLPAIDLSSTLSSI